MQTNADIIDLTSQPIRTTAVDHVYASAAGGIATFLGTTRDETTAEGKRLVALDYEAYPEMATKQMHALVAEARTRWPIVRCVMLHRVGRVNVAEPSVLIAVATPHRGEAFEACRWLIDELKKSVSIWKKEVWDDGATTWVEGAVPKT